MLSYDVEFFGKIDYSKPVALVLLDGLEKFGLKRCITIENQYGRTNTLIFTAENITHLPEKIAEIAKEASSQANFHFFQLTHHTQFPHVPKSHSTYGASTVTDRKGVLKKIHDKGLIEELDHLPGGTKNMVAYWGGCSVSPVVASHFRLTAIEGIHRDAAFSGNLNLFLKAISTSANEQDIRRVFEKNTSFWVQSALDKSLNLAIGNVLEGNKSHGFKPRVFNAESWQDFVREKNLGTGARIP